MNALAKIKAAGFVVELEEGGLFIEPFSRLTQPQLEFLKFHKIEIMEELELERDKAKNAVDAIIRNLVTCYTPNGKPIDVEATSSEHAAWLLKMNPPPMAYKGYTS